MSYSVGKDVLSYCNKCKLTLSHIIVSMLDSNSIAKVQCNTCKSTHKYKDPAAATVSKVKRSSAAGAKKKKTKSTGVPLAEVWKARLADLTTEPVKYTIRTIFIVGDVVDHPKFGLGVVEEVIDSTKVNVLFENEVKTLIHGK